MKQLVRYFTWLALASAAWVSCADSESEVTADALAPLCIEVQPQDFSDADAATRASLSADMELKLEAGDAIGLFAVRDGAVTHHNVRVTFDGTVWTPASQIPHVAGTQYFAYYPYNASLSTEVKSVEQIVTAFTVPTDQSDDDKFLSADLLASPLSEPEVGTTVRLQLLHRLTLVEVVMSSKCTPQGGIYIGDTEYQARLSERANGAKVFRIIAKPGATQIRYRYDLNGILEQVCQTVSLEAGRVNLFDPIGEAAVPERIAVDLGLSVLWAPFNVGAESENFGEADIAASAEALGWRLAWGETSPKSKYGQSTYTNPDLSWSPTGGSIIGTEHDAAHVSWKGNWVMPTQAQLKELFDNCTITTAKTITLGGYTYYKYRLTSKVLGYTSQSIYLMSTGYTDKESTAISRSNLACYLSGEAGSTNLQKTKYARIESTSNVSYLDDSGSRWTGMMVRAVRPKNDTRTGVLEYIRSHAMVDMGLPSGTRWAAVNCGAEEDIDSYSDLTPAKLIDYGQTTLGWRLSWGDVAKPTGFGKTGDNPNFDWINVTSRNDHILLSTVSNIIGNEQYDVARHNWGSGWQMPSEAQWKELIEECDITSQGINGRLFFKFTNKNDATKYIYIIANGYIDNQIYYSQTGVMETSQGFYSIGEQYDETNDTKQKVVHLWVDGSTANAEIVEETVDDYGVTTTAYPYLSKATGMMVRAVYCP